MANELFPSGAWHLLLPDLESSDPGSSMADQPVVAYDFEPATLAALSRRLPPGGVCYLQSSWPRHRPISRASGLLREAGFERFTIYSLSKSDDRWKTSWWVPVGEPGVIAYLVDQRGKAAKGHRNWRAGLTRFLLRVAADSVATVAAHPWLLHPRRNQELCVVAVKSPQGRAGPSTSPVPGLALGCVVDGRPGQGRSVAAAMRVGGSSTDQPMLLVFENGNSQPAAVVKAPDRPEEVAGTRHEQRILQAMADGPRPVHGVPRPLNLTAGPGLVAVGQTGIAGRPLTAHATPENFAPLARLVTDWLVQLALATSRPATADRYQTLIDRSVRVLVETTSSSPSFVEDTEGLVDSLRSCDPGITVVQHRDFGPWNINLDDSRAIGVIDWAGATVHGVPGCDLIHFLTHLALCANDGYGAEDRRRIYACLGDPASSMGQTADRCLGAYFDGLGINRPDDATLRILTWMLAVRRQTPSERIDSIYRSMLNEELSRRSAQRGART